MNRKPWGVVVVGLLATVCALCYLPIFQDGAIAPVFGFVPLTQIRGENDICWPALAVELTSIWLWTRSAWLDFRKPRGSIVLQWSVYLLIFAIGLSYVVCARSNEWLMAPACLVTLITGWVKLGVSKREKRPEIFPGLQERLRRMYRSFQRRRTPRICRFALVFVLVLLLPVSLFCATAERRQQRNVRLAEAVFLEDEARVHALLAEHADPNALMQPLSLSLGDLLERVWHPEWHRGHRSTILMYAANHGGERILRSLLDAGGDVHDKTAYGFTALMIAADSRHHRNVALLVQYGSDVNFSGESTTPLIEATSHASNLEDVSCLLAHGADPNHTIDSKTPLNCSATYGDTESVLALIHAGASVDGGDPGAGTALMCAASRGNPKTISALLRAGADINACDAYSQTSLIYAASAGKREAVVTLLKAGADARLCDKGGESAEDSAVAQGHKEITHLLHNYRHPLGQR